MNFDIIKFFEGYLIYGIKDKNKEIWVFKLIYLFGRMIFNVNVILYI